MLRGDVERSFNLFFAGQNLVDQAVFFRFGCFQPFVAVRIEADLLRRLAGVVCQDFVQLVTQLHDLAGSDLNINRSSLRAARWLVDHHTCVRER